MASAEAFVSGENWRILEKISIVPDTENSFPANTLAEKYRLWEKSLRNSLVKLRAVRTASDAVNSMRDTDFECDADRAAVHAYSAATPLEREKLLDAARFAKIDEMSACQVFSFDMVCAYKLKLALALKWSARRDRQKADALLSDTVSQILRTEKKS